MNLKSLLFCSSLILLSALDGTQVVFAATLVQCQLVMDGAKSPAGDRIDCILHLQPEDQDVRLEVRAFLLNDKQAVKLTAIQASHDRNRDPQGRLLVSEDVSTTLPTIEKSLIIPYADLTIPVGENRLVYQVTLHVQGQTVWTQPLPVTLARISDHARTRLQPQVIGQSAAVRTQTVKAHIAASAEPFGHRSLKIEADATQLTKGLTSASVSISRNFERFSLQDTSEASEKTKGLDGQPWKPYSEVAQAQERIVYFATNRLTKAALNSDEGPSRTSFSSDVSDDLSLGKCVVNFPIRHHKRGALEVASWFARSDPEKHFLVEAVQILGRDELMGPLGENDILIFVHGFNSSFDDAVLRAGQLQYDSDFPGNVLAFSWPSLGLATTDDYQRDEERAEKSVRALADLLELTKRTASESSPARKIHVIAHSLGNRLLLAAIHDLAQRNVWQPDKKYLGQVVLAAPDVSAIRFNNVIGYAIKSAEQVSYYYCRADLALKMSQSINQSEPVGLFPYFQAGLDTINADGVDTSFIGHGYYGASVKMLSDFNLLFCYNYSPSQRMPPLSTHTRVYDHDHWSFLPVQIREQ